MAMTRRRLALAFTALAVLAVAGPAHAQSLVNAPDQLVATFRGLASGWTATFQRFAAGTFGLLAILHLTWKGCKLALRGAGLQEFLAELVGAIMFIGFGAAVLANGPALINDIVDSFRQAGAAAGSAPLTPGAIVAAAVNMAQAISKHLSFAHIGESLGLILIALIVAVCLALIVGQMVLVLIQVAFLVPVATFMLGFSGSEWTREIAFSAVRQSFALGMELMILELIAGSGFTILAPLVASLDNVTLNSGALTVLVAIVLTVLALKLPTWFAGMLGGASIGAASMVAGAGAAAIGGAAGAALGAAGVGAMGLSASRLAGAEMAGKVAAGTAPTSALGRAASSALSAVNHMAAAPLSDASRRLTGQHGANHGVGSWRMAADMGNRARLLGDDTSGKPQPGAGASGGTSSSGFGGGASRPAPEPWMAMSGGFDALTPQHQASAQQSYATWAEDNPELGRRHDLADYVSYVQEREAERRNPASPRRTA